MEALFTVGTVYDVHLTSIVNMMLTRLKNNKPKQDSKCYIKTCNYIQELYDGSYLRHHFDESQFNQYDMTNYQDKVMLCKGNWQHIRNTINDCLNHIEMAKDGKYLPFNKKYIEGITFASFFESYSINNFNGLINSNFLKFINEPKLCQNFVRDKTIQTLKTKVSDSFIKSAENFAKKYFKIKKEEVSFWHNMVDWTRWLNCFKESFPKIYSEFISCCKGNIFLDYKNWLLDNLKNSTSQLSYPEAVMFQLSMQGSERIEGHFRSWLIEGIKTSRFSILKQLPYNVTYYYTDQSWNTSSDVRIIEKPKEVVNIEDVLIF